MWWPLLAAILIHLVVVQPVNAYSRFGQPSEELRAQLIRRSPHTINYHILGGSNIQYHGRFRSGQDDVLNRYFHRFT
ncbi:hypothetical protein GCK32_008221 [Trichostrongylus colubriformis]|uniref:Secreted protein n=1 Tax=Trichostrongylus colubriformis TaxID=6319 RepID=A0AAN8IUK2_TRICO